MLERSGELFALHLRLTPTAAGEVHLNSGAPAQAAFLDLLRQIDPDLAEKLHAANHRRPYTLELLRGFNHLPATERDAAMAGAQPVRVDPGQAYWLRVTILDSQVFSIFTQALLRHTEGLLLRIGAVTFAVTRVVGLPETGETQPSWVGYTTFADLLADRAPRRAYHIEFASPTAFSLGQRSWGKALALFPEPVLFWHGLARMWDIFTPADLQIAENGVDLATLDAFCAAEIVVSRYDLATRYLPAARFGQTGFQGTVEYQVMGGADAPASLWLTPLARFAFFAGIGYKTTMGMGQVRWIPAPEPLRAGGPR